MSHLLGCSWRQDPGVQSVFVPDISFHMQFVGRMRGELLAEEEEANLVLCECVYVYVCAHVGRVGVERVLRSMSHVCRCMLVYYCMDMYILYAIRTSLHSFSTGKCSNHQVPLIP